VLKEPKEMWALKDRKELLELKEPKEVQALKARKEM
jgi:hypothetical protein